MTNFEKDFLGQIVPCQKLAKILEIWVFVPFLLKSNEFLSHFFHSEGNICPAGLVWEVTAAVQTFNIL